MAGIPENALVVRGGIATNESLRRNAEATEAHEDFGYLGVSVFAGIDVTVEELVRIARREIPNALPNGKLSLSQGDRLATFTTKNTISDHHYDIILPDITEPSLTELVQCFEEPIPNPVPPNETNSG